VPLGTCEALPVCDWLPDPDADGVRRCDPLRVDVIDGVGACVWLVDGDSVPEAETDCEGVGVSDATYVFVCERLWDWLAVTDELTLMDAVSDFVWLGVGAWLALRLLDAERLELLLWVKEALRDCDAESDCDCEDVADGLAEKLAVPDWDVEAAQETLLALIRMEPHVPSFA
jgi:hypothetical protein